MSTSTLMTTSSKFQSRLTSRDALATLPEPMAIGRRHKPVPHAVLVEQILKQVWQRDMIAVREQYALSKDGGALFGVMDLRQADSQMVTRTDRGMSIGFRSSTNSTLSINLVAGQRITVCDNLMLSGQMIALRRKSTTALDIGYAVAGGFDRFLQHEQRLEVSIEILEQTQLTDGEAKQKIFDVFNASVVPVRLFGDVARNYFQPADDATDCQPRSAWGLHNSFTRAMRDLTPNRLFGATVALGRAFDIGVNDATRYAPIVSDSPVGWQEG